MSEKLKLASLFDGSGGFPLAGMIAGISAARSGNNVVISGSGSGSCTVTVTSGETSNYTAASAGIAVKSSAANCQCTKSECNSYKKDKKKSVPSNCARQCYDCYSCSCSCSCGGGD